MDPVPGTEVDLPEVDNIMKLKVKVTPTDGLYQGATFSFDLDIPHNYPYEPPKATCTTMVQHCTLAIRAPPKQVLAVCRLFTQWPPSPPPAGVPP
jgi:ubiquitin-protein ligase